MDIFFTLFINLIPLYALIAAGYIGSRYFGIDRLSLANLAIYIGFPVTIFGFIVALDLRASYLFLPLLTFILSCIIGYSSLWLGQRVFKDKRANLLSLCASMGNTGYFGLPVVLLLFPTEMIGVYMFMLLGFVLYEGTFGYYIAARGNWSPKDSFIKLMKFPSLYAISAGLLYNLSGLPLPDLFLKYWEYFKGFYVIVGMMIIGSALAGVKKLVIGQRFIALTFAGKFMLWPLLTGAFILIDKTALNLFDDTIHNMMVVISLVPPAANVTAFATQLDLIPEKAATTILLGTLFALFYIPFILWVMGMNVS